MPTSASIVSYATFLEVRARRERVVLELARRSTEAVNECGDLDGSPLAIEADAIEPHGFGTAAGLHPLSPVKM